MQAVAMAKDQAYRRGHLPMRDDGRQGRVALICVHCGAQAVYRGQGGLMGTLVSPWGRCIGFEPVSARDRELAEMYAEDDWPRSAVAEANWAARNSWAMNRFAASLPRGGR